PLADLREGLKSVTYQKVLGSLWDKCMRVAELARVTANRVGVDAGLAAHAASLCKCDLLTRMVGEFPELQGVMGRYYAAAHGEPAELAEALDAFYQPRQAGDPVAAGKLGQVLAVAERLDTLAGIFAVGQKPTGTRDPFALRRAALGLARTLIEGGLDIALEPAFIEALDLLPAIAGATDKPGLAGELYDFVLDRLRGYYAEQGLAVEAFEAVLAVRPASLSDFDRRLRAVAAFAALPEAASLAAANKRVGNLLRKQDAIASRTVDPRLFDADAERALAAALQAARAETDRAMDAGDYAGALARLAALQAPVDRFFDEVLVMAEDAGVRGNRLALLAELQARFLAIADIARLQAVDNC
ncbi:MAG TPA: glycine--tRNA ligase subunit beta, partial [Oleiagrimonas sp.]|nr:glycine--tRNA ligase subunit beta [Oleiagrimonas sp.]